jgi:hypothetical protein
MQETKIAFSATGGVPTKRFRRFVAARASFGEIREALVAAGEIPDVPNLRFWTTWGSEFYRAIAEMDAEWSMYETIRIDAVPESQEGLPEGSELVVVHLMVDSLSRPFTGRPFYFVFNWDESVEELRMRLQAAQGASDAEFEKMKAAISSQAKPSEIERIELTGSESVRTVVAADGDVEITDVKLFLLVPPARRSPIVRREEAVKIYN